MQGLRDLCDRSGGLEDFVAARHLFDAINANLFVQFGEKAWGKRKVRRPVSGVLTFGDEPLPIRPYEGPTDHASVKATGAASAAGRARPSLPAALV